MRRFLDRYSLVISLFLAALAGASVPAYIYPMGWMPPVVIAAYAAGVGLVWHAVRPGSCLYRLALTVLWPVGYPFLLMFFPARDLWTAFIGRQYLVIDRKTARRPEGSHD